MSKKILTLDNVPVINKKIGKIDTIEKLKASTIYSLGDVVEVLGFHTKGDGAHHYRQKVDSTYNGSDAINCVDGTKWKIVHNGEVNTSWFGNDIGRLLAFVEVKKIGDKKLELVGYTGHNIKDFSNLDLALNYSGTNGIIVNDSYIKDSKIEVVGDNKITQAMFGGVNFKFENSSIRNPNGMAFQANNSTKSTIEILDSDIDSSSYAVLINYNSITDKYTILNNNITSFNSDAIEINLPDETKYRTEFGLINGNAISSKDDRTSVETTASGFAIGVAQGHNTIVTNNYIKDSREEAIHFEDCSLNTIVANNIIKGSKEGFRLLYNSKNGLKSNSPIIDSNYFIKNGAKESIGLRHVSDLSGTHNHVNIGQNSFSNYNIAISNESSRPIGPFVNINDCNYAGVKNFWGNLFIDGSLNSIHQDLNADDSLFYNAVLLDKTTIELTDSTLAKLDNSDTYTTFKSLSYKINNKNPITAGYPVHKLCRMPASYDGFVEVKYANNEGSVNRNTSVYKVKIINGQLIESERINLKSNGSVSASTIIRDGDYLCLRHYCATDIGQGFYLEVRFNDTLLKYPTSVAVPSVTLNIVNLDTPYYSYKMQQQGIYEDYVAYRDELHEYKNSQTADETMLLPVLKEPKIPESVKAFAEKYKLI